MCSNENRIRVVKLFIKLRTRPKLTISHLGADKELSEEPAFGVRAKSRSARRLGKSLVTCYSRC